VCKALQVHEDTQVKLVIGGLLVPQEIKVITLGLLATGAAHIFSIMAGTKELEDKAMLEYWWHVMDQELPVSITEDEMEYYMLVLVLTAAGDLSL
jgi:hypothetical protein